jgi:hypothetical protein
MPGVVGSVDHLALLSGLTRIGKLLLAQPNCLCSNCGFVPQDRSRGAASDRGYGLDLSRSRQSATLRPAGRWSGFALAVGGWQLLLAGPTDEGSHLFASVFGGRSSQSQGSIVRSPRALAAREVRLARITHRLRQRLPLAATRLEDRGTEQPWKRCCARFACTCWHSRQAQDRESGCYPQSKV